MKNTFCFVSLDSDSVILMLSEKQENNNTNIIYLKQKHILYHCNADKSDKDQKMIETMIYLIDQVEKKFNYIIDEIIICNSYNYHYILTKSTINFDKKKQVQSEHLDNFVKSSIDYVTKKYDKYTVLDVLHFTYNINDTIKILNPIKTKLQTLTANIGILSISNDVLEFMSYKLNNLKIRQKHFIPLVFSIWHHFKTQEIENYTYLYIHINNDFSSCVVSTGSVLKKYFNISFGISEIKDALIQNLNINDTQVETLLNAFNEKDSSDYIILDNDRKIYLSEVKNIIEFNYKNILNNIKENLNINIKFEKVLILGKGGMIKYSCIWCNEVLGSFTERIFDQNIINILQINNINEKYLEEFLPFISCANFYFSNINIHHKAIHGFIFKKKSQIKLFFDWLIF